MLGCAGRFQTGHIPVTHSALFLCNFQSQILATPWASAQTFFIISGRSSSSPLPVQRVPAPSFALYEEGGWRGPVPC